MGAIGLTAEEFLKYRENTLKIKNTQKKNTLRLIININEIFF